jgi:lipopolysaccharide export system protein LptA
MKVASAIAFALLLGTASLAAHHSFAAEYDGDKPVTISGTVAKIDWQNPHIYFYLDVKNDKGAVTQWRGIRQTCWSARAGRRTSR